LSHTCLVYLKIFAIDGKLHDLTPGLNSGAMIMQQPSTQVDTEFAQFLQGLPADWETRMRELGAFTYAGKIPSPPELLRAIFLYCGPDQSLREVAGTLTLRAERITDQAIWKRLHRCAPFLITLLKQMLSLEELPALPGAHLIPVHSSLAFASLKTRFNAGPRFDNACQFPKRGLLECHLASIRRREGILVAIAGVLIGGIARGTGL
jgi:hypothetical protein